MADVAGIARSIEAMRAEQPFRKSPLAAAADRYLGVGDLFKIGIGPSSSHTVGPMRAAAAFASRIDAGMELLAGRLTVTLHGSLAWTGQGHGTLRAIICGLCGFEPQSVDPERLPQIEASVAAAGRLRTVGGANLPFDPQRDIILDRGPPLPRHPNAMTFRLEGWAGDLLASEIWYSVGGGFVEREGETAQASSMVAVPHWFTSADSLMAIGALESLSIAEIMFANESASHGAEATLAVIDEAIAAMMECIDRGLAREGILPGGLRVKRRAKGLFDKPSDAGLATSSCRPRPSTMPRPSLSR